MANKEYAIKAPDGSVIRFTAPDDAPKERILAFAKKQFSAKQAPEQSPGQAPSQPEAVAPESVQSSFDQSRFDQLMGINPQQAIAYAQQTSALDNSKAAAAEREAKLVELEKTSPFQAKALREMGGLEKVLIGTGAGFADLLTGVGLRDRDAGEELATQQIADTSKAFGAGRALGQSAPFAGAGFLAGSAMKGAPIAAHALTQGAIGATEGGIIASGTGGDAGDIVEGALIGGAVGGGAEVIGPFLNRAARALIKRVKGEAPAGRLIDAAGRPTAELNKVLEESGETFDNLVEEATRRQKAESTESIVGAGRADTPEAAIDDVAISQGRLESAERLGLEGSAPIAVLTEDQATQELAGALSAVQGSRASSALDSFTEEFGRKADEYVQSLGGSIDRGAVTDDLLSGMQSDISRIKALENKLYKPIDDAIGRDTQVPLFAGSLRNKLAAKARNSKGIKRLPRHEREILEMIDSPEGFSYQNLIDKMNDVGSAAYRQTKAYDDIDTASLKNMYNDLKKVRQNVADTYGVGEKMKRAKSLGASRFGLQESAEALFGKNLDKSIFPRVDRAVKGLEKGSVREFRATMESIPEKHRKAVAATMLNTAMTGGRNQALGVNSGQFSKWYSNLKRSDSAMGALNQYVGPEAMKRLDDFGELAKGVSGVTKGRVRTGVTSEALKSMDNVDGMIGKLYGAAQRVQGIPIVGRGAAAVGNTAKMLTMEKIPAVEAADSLMSSTRFRKAAIEAARSGTDSRKFRRLNASLKSSPEYKKYLKQLDSTTQSSIAASGLIAWLASEEEEN